MPSKHTVPDARGTSPIAALASVDLPQPDSPTRPTTWPGRTSRSTSTTACTGGNPWRWYSTVRLRISRLMAVTPRASDEAPGSLRGRTQYRSGDQRPAWPGNERTGRRRRPRPGRPRSLERRDGLEAPRLGEGTARRERAARRAAIGRRRLAADDPEVGAPRGRVGQAVEQAAGVRMAWCGRAARRPGPTRRCVRRTARAACRRAPTSRRGRG